MDVTDIQDTTQLTIFESLTERSCIDLVDIAPWSFLRDHLRSWDTAESSIKGCITLRLPHFVRCTLPLTDKSCPVMLLLTHLVQLGYTPHMKKVVHSASTTAKLLDNRDLRNSRLYLQCVLASGELCPSKSFRCIMFLFFQTGFA